MANPFYAKSSKNQGYIKNMEVISFHDLNGVYAFQPQMYKNKDGRYFIYYGSMKGNGVSILDVTDPAAPKWLNYLEVADKEKYGYMCTGKIQICDDILIAGNSGVIPLLHGAPPKENAKNPGGINIYSLKEDPANPKFVSHWDTGWKMNGEEAGWVHRFTYNGGRYVHLTAFAPDFIGFIYRIIDIGDINNPVEVGHWYEDIQYQANKMQKTGIGDIMHNCLHMVYADEAHGRAYLSHMEKGYYILDISDVNNPHVIGHLPMTPPFSSKLAGARCHTFFPLTGRDYAIATQEGERFFCQSKEKVKESGAQPLNTIVMIDISNPADPTLISVFPYPEVPEDFPYPNFNDCGLGANGPFGPHNLHEPMSNKTWIEDNPNRAYNCYFHAGMRVYDTTDPFNVKEIAYFIPPNPEKLCYEVDCPGPVLGTAEDCVVDDRGYIYMNCMQDGMYVLKCLV